MLSMFKSSPDNNKNATVSTPNRKGKKANDTLTLEDILDNDKQGPMSPSSYESNLIKRDDELEQLRQMGLAKLLNKHFTDETKKIAEEKAAAEAAIAELKARKKNLTIATKNGNNQYSRENELTEIDRMYMELNKQRAECRRKEKETLLLYQRYVNRYGKTGHISIPPLLTSSTTTPTKTDNTTATEPTTTSATTITNQASQQQQEVSASGGSPPPPPPPPPTLLPPNFWDNKNNPGSNSKKQQQQKKHNVEEFAAALDEVINSNSHVHFKEKAQGAPPVSESVVDDRSHGVPVVYPSSPSPNEKVVNHTDETPIAITAKSNNSNHTNEDPLLGKKKDSLGVKDSSPEKQRTTPINLEEANYDAHNFDVATAYGTACPGVHDHHYKKEISIHNNDDNDDDDRSVISGITFNSVFTREILNDAQSVMDEFLRDETENIRQTMKKKKTSSSSSSLKRSTSKNNKSSSNNLLTNSEDDTDSNSLLSFQSEHDLSKGSRQYSLSELGEQSQKGADVAENMVLTMQKILNDFNEETSKEMEAANKAISDSTGRPVACNNPEENWMAYYDEAFEREYFVELNSNKTQWFPPEGPEATPRNNAMNSLSSVNSNNDTSTNINDRSLDDSNNGGGSCDVSITSSQYNNYFMDQQRSISHTEFMPELSSSGRSGTGSRASHGRSSRIMQYRKMRRRRRNRKIIMGVISVTVAVLGYYYVKTQHPTVLDSMNATISRKITDLNNKYPHFKVVTDKLQILSITTSTTTNNNDLSSNNKKEKQNKKVSAPPTMSHLIDEISNYNQKAHDDEQQQLKLEEQKKLEQQRKLEQQKLEQQRLEQQRLEQQQKQQKLEQQQKLERQRKQQEQDEMMKKKDDDSTRMDKNGKGNKKQDKNNKSNIKRLPWGCNIPFAQLLHGGCRRLASEQPKYNLATLEQKNNLAHYMLD